MNVMVNLEDVLRVLTFRLSLGKSEMAGNIAGKISFIILKGSL